MWLCNCEYAERILDTMEVTALVKAACPSSSLWGLGVFWALPIDRSLLWGTPHLSLHIYHSTLVTPCLSLCLSVMVPFLFTPWQEVRRVWKLLFMLASWRAVILLCICMQLTSHCPEAVCPLRGWTSVCLGQQLCTGAHVKWVTKKCVIHVRPRSAKSGDYWLPKNPSLNWERCLYSWSREVLLLDKE